MITRCVFCLLHTLDNAAFTFTVAESVVLSWGADWICSFQWFSNSRGYNTIDIQLNFKKQVNNNNLIKLGNANPKL